MYKYFGKFVRRWSTSFTKTSIQGLTEILRIWVQSFSFLKKKLKLDLKKLYLDHLSCVYYRFTASLNWDFLFFLFAICLIYYFILFISPSFCTYLASHPLYCSPTTLTSSWVIPTPIISMAASIISALCTITLLLPPLLLLHHLSIRTTTKTSHLSLNTTNPPHLLHLSEKLSLSSV